MNPASGGERFEFIIPPELTSRGIGDAVALSDACILDFMPPVLGSQFQTNDTLREDLHRTGDHTGPFLYAHQLYLARAKRATAAGSTDYALDAYRRALHYNTEFVRGMRRMEPGVVALPEDQIAHFDIGHELREIEEELVRQVWQRDDFSYNPDTYRDFVLETRRRELAYTRLRCLFYWASTSEGERVPQRHDPALGAELMELTARMGLFNAALDVAKVLGRADKIAEYTPLAEAMPDESGVQRAIHDRDY